MANCLLVWGHSKGHFLAFIMTIWYSSILLELPAVDYYPSEAKS